LKVLFDTSVLIAALTGRHVQHAVSIPWLERALAEEVVGLVSTHSLAELYAILTGHPDLQLEAFCPARGRRSSLGAGSMTV
jgi:predicted nucleic acid-binding protein